MNTSHRPSGASRVLLAVLAFACVAGLASSAFAYDVFVNGVRVTGLKNQTFKGCEVEFDVAGNILITAPGYKVIDPSTGGGTPPAPTDKPKPAAERPAGTFVLFYQLSGAVGYFFSVFINGDLFREIKPGDTNFAVDISERLRKGFNQLRVVARKDPKAPAGTSADRAQLIFGAGKDDGSGTFQMERILWEVLRTGKDREGLEDTRTVELK